SLRVDADGGVAGAVVFLEQIAHGRNSLPVGGVVERRGCRVWPPVAIVAPIGARLRLFNADAAPWSPGVHDARGELLTVELAGRGQGTSVPVARSGLFSLRSADGIGGWLVVPRHPY